MTDEARALTHVFEAGVAVPEVVHICPPEDRLGLSYIMRFIEGQTIARKILRDDGAPRGAVGSTMRHHAGACTGESDNGWRVCPALMPGAVGQICQGFARQRPPHRFKIGNQMVG